MKREAFSSADSLKKVPLQPQNDMSNQDFWDAAALTLMNAQASDPDYELNNAKVDVVPIAEYADALLEERKKRIKT